MSKVELGNTVKKARKLKVKIEELQAEFDALTSTLKSEMESREVDTLTGADWKITYKTVISNRLDSTALKRELPEIAARYNKQISAKRFTIS